MTQTESIDKAEILKDGKIGKLILQYALPNIIGMIVFASYIIIIQIYIAHGSGLGVHAVGGIGICLPIMVLLIAISTFTGLGAAAHISICMGQGDKETACDLLGNAVTLSIILSLAFTLLFFLFFESILRLIGASEENYQYVKDFMIVYIPSVIIIIVTGCMNTIMRAAGHPKKSMMLILFGFSLNILVTPIFLYVLKWGIKGVALGMVLCQFVAFIPTLWHFLKKGNSLPLRMRSLKLNGAVVKMISKIGFSPFLVISVMSIIALIANNRLMTYGGAFAISTYTISNTFMTFVGLILSGLSQGVQPIIGYNYGAKKITRVLKTLKITGSAAVLIGITGLIIAYFFSYLLAAALSPDDKLIAEESVRCLRILAIGLPLSGFLLTVNSFFQSIGSAGKAFALSITRQLVFLVPAMFIFPLFWQTRGIWYAVPFTEISSALLAIIILAFQRKELNRQKELENEYIL
ncbi:MAG: MATE family efflux transporter [Candidatus Azobacteroides sp.]|nr:MATE family efflux transporter [Candidatus Azobacteroides sp.]